MNLFSSFLQLACIGVLGQCLWSRTCSRLLCVDIVERGHTEHVLGYCVLLLLSVVTHCCYMYMSQVRQTLL